MSHCITIVGARPQFIKASVLSRALSELAISESMLHTGQHFSADMDEIFFRELCLPAPRWNLGINGGSHGTMTGDMLRLIEGILAVENPKLVIVYGDTNSTLAGALAAVKLHLPIAHVEAGLRSYVKEMPEEVNRVCTDHLSTLLFCTGERGALNLRREGITSGVHISGDIMADAFHHSLMFRPTLSSAGEWQDVGGFSLLSLHRAQNTELPGRLHAIFGGLAASGRKFLFPVHPRTAAALKARQVPVTENIRLLPPLGHAHLLYLLARCDLVVTDSGGLQKEACWAGKPCITLREETEWPETVEAGCNVLVGADTKRLCTALHSPPEGVSPEFLTSSLGAGRRIAAVIADFIKNSWRNAKANHEALSAPVIA